MKFVDLVKTTLQAIKQSQPVIEGGHEIHIQMQTKGYDSALSSASVSLLHEFNTNRNALMQSATVDFLRAENARLWDERRELCRLKTEKLKEADKLALKGFVSDSNELNRSIEADLGRKIHILNDKIKGIRVALDHAIHAGGDLFAERPIEWSLSPTCYDDRVFPKDYDSAPVNFLPEDGQTK